MHCCFQFFLDKDTLTILPDKTFVAPPSSHTQRAIFTSYNILITPASLFQLPYQKTQSCPQNSSTCFAPRFRNFSYPTSFFVLSTQPKHPTMYTSQNKFPAKISKMQVLHNSFHFFLKTCIIILLGRYKIEDIFNPFGQLNISKCERLFNQIK